MAMGEMFKTSDGKSINAFVKPTLTFPRPKRAISGIPAPKDTDAFLNAYWAVLSKQTVDEGKANCKKATRNIVVKVGSLSQSIDVPIIVNTKALHAGDDVILFSKADNAEEPSEPPAKRQKGAGKGKAAGSGKGKRGK